jgi:hypothetical protein
MLVWPAIRSAPIARLRNAAATRGALPTRIRDRSSSKVTSLAQWIRFSIPNVPEQVYEPLQPGTLRPEAGDEERGLDGRHLVSQVRSVPDDPVGLASVREQSFGGTSDIRHSGSEGDLGQPLVR